MANDDLESLILLNKITSKETVLAVCEDAFTNRLSTKFPSDVLKRTGASIGVDNPSQIEKFLRNLCNVAEQCLQAGCERPEQAISALKASADHGPVLTLALPLWRSLAVSSMVSPPKLKAFSTQICTKTSSSDSQTSSCLLNLTLEDGSKTEDLTVDLSKATMATLVADLSRVRDQLAVIAGQK